jgi:hypothetical protein
MLRLSELEAAYIAGLFDGDGCVSVQTNKAGQAYPKAHIANQHKPTLEWIVCWFGGSVSRSHACYNWQKFNALDFFETIQPYVRIKRSAVDTAVEFGRLLRTYHGVPIAERQPFVDRIRVQNKETTTLFHEGVL